MIEAESSDILLLLKQGKHDIAEDRARHMLQCDKADAKWLYNVASYIKDAGDFKKADKLFKEIIKKSYSTDLIILGLSYFKLAEMNLDCRQLDKAIENAQKCLFYYPTHKKAKLLISQAKKAARISVTE